MPKPAQPVCPKRVSVTTIEVFWPCHHKSESMSRICAIFIAMLTLFPENLRAAPEEQSIVEAIAKLPRPRQVHIKRTDLVMMLGGSTLLVVVWLSFLGDLWENGFARQSGILDKSFLVLWMILLPVLYAKSARDIIRSRDLLACGDVTFGLILEVQVGRRNRHNIRYSFQDAAGRVITASSIDDSRHVFEGSVVPVFFDPANPEKRCVPLCGVSWEIVFPTDAMPPITGRFPDIP